jgi:5-methylcytosine-specific restriction protein A
MLGKQLRPKSICKHPACGKLIDMAGYCDSHQAIQDKLDAERRKNRTHNYSKMYGSEWRKVRNTYLKANPLCVVCFAKCLIVPANVVDHIKPHKGDKNLFWDEDNYQPLCKPCHDAKTAKEDGGFGNRPRGYS